MKKRKKTRKAGDRTTIRLSDDIMGAVRKIENVTGWTFGVAVSFLSNAGIDALYGGGRGIDAMRNVLTAAVDVHHGELAAAEVARQAKVRLSEARKVMNAQVAPPASIPDRPESHGGGVQATGKRRGRPPKHRTEPAELNENAASGTLEGPGGV